MVIFVIAVIFAYITLASRVVEVSKYRYFQYHALTVQYLHFYSLPKLLKNTALQSDFNPRLHRYWHYYKCVYVFSDFSAQALRGGC